MDIDYQKEKGGDKGAVDNAQNTPSADSPDDGKEGDQRVYFYFSADHQRFNDIVDG